MTTPRLSRTLRRQKLAVMNPVPAAAGKNLKNVAAANPE
jgi:hypothetical protein